MVPVLNVQSRVSSMQWRRGLAAMATLALTSASAAAQSASTSAAMPVETAIPVLFTSTTNAARVHSGDVVRGKTMEAVFAGPGKVVPEGSRVFGHVVEARGFTFDETPYAPQQPSYLVVHMDSMRVDGRDVVLHAKVRALASALATDDATRPPATDMDVWGTTTQIGGDHLQDGDNAMYSPDDEIVGYRRKQGVVAHLLPASYRSHGSVRSCGGTTTEQAVALFSASACGLYGFPHMDLSDDGAADGTFRLESRRYTVSLQANGAALLQVISVSTSATASR
jgi:hypothetical protein